jgi:hypothetical protein
MRTLDNVSVSIPNQELLKAEIDTYGKKPFPPRLRDYGGLRFVFGIWETALLHAADKLLQMNHILDMPKPYVWVTSLTTLLSIPLYVFISDIKRMPQIDANIKRVVLQTCNEHKIEICTPTIIKNVQSSAD